MPTMKDLAEEYGVEVSELRATSNVGDVVTEEQQLTPLQEQNVRGSWEQQRAARS